MQMLVYVGARAIGVRDGEVWAETPLLRLPSHGASAFLWSVGSPYCESN